MNTSLQLTFENHEVEIIRHNEINLFNPYDVGRCLGLTKSAVRNHLQSMNKNQVIKLKNSDLKDTDIRPLNNAGENFITESGLYKLIFKSNKPNAEKFADWVTDEVLPLIRKTGSYSLSEVEQPKQIAPEETINTLNLKDINSMARLIIKELDRSDASSKCRLKVITEIYKQANIDIGYIDEVQPSKDEYYIGVILKVYENMKEQYKDNDKGLVEALEFVESDIKAPVHGKRIATTLIKCLLAKENLQFNYYFRD